VIDDGGPDDRSLLDAHCRGDADAFATLFRRHRDRLWAVAIRTLGDREEAADALQDAMISAFRNAEHFRGDAQVSTWMHRIVVNACLDRIRRRKARPTVALDGHEIRTRHDEHAAAVTRLDLRAALARLPDAQRIALVLVDLEGLPVTEVSELLGVAEGTIKSRCARARTALAVDLRGADPGAGYGESTDSPHRRNPGAGSGVTAGGGQPAGPAGGW
jgi:RNA polymerase sigma-70 factor (ECF subfamily)